MELFEILFILIFILIPLFEGIRKSRQTPPDAGDGPGQEPARPEPDAAPAEAEPARAADMLPDDLWEVLTGERRQAPTPAEVDTEPVPWYEDPEWSPDEAGPDEAERFEPTPWIEEPTASPHDEWRRPDEPDRDVEPVPEPAPRRRPLREVQVEPERRRRQSPLLRSLQGGRSLRQAVVLREVLGPPRGLDRQG